MHIVSAVHETSRSVYPLNVIMNIYFIFRKDQRGFVLMNAYFRISNTASRLLTKWQRRHDGFYYYLPFSAWPRINIKEGLLIKQTRQVLATFINLGLKPWFIFSSLRPFKYTVGTIMSEWFEKLHAKKAQLPVNS
jgi:hypothetical protein